MSFSNSFTSFQNGGEWLLRKAYVFWNKHTANYLRLLTEVSCSPSVASPREARNSPSLRFRARERERVRVSQEKKSGKIISSHFVEAYICARARAFERERRSFWPARVSHSREKKLTRVAQPTSRVAYEWSRDSLQLGSARPGTTASRLTSPRTPRGRHVHISRRGQSEAPADSSADQSARSPFTRRRDYPATARKRTFSPYPAASIHCRRRPCMENPVILCVPICSNFLNSLMGFFFNIYWRNIWLM